MKTHPNQSQYPIIETEFNTRFFDSVLISSIKEMLNEEDDAEPIVWDELILKDQVLMQIGFIAAPPRGSIEDELSSEENWANKVLLEINRINSVE